MTTRTCDLRIEFYEAAGSYAGWAIIENVDLGWEATAGDYFAPGALGHAVQRHCLDPLKIDHIELYPSIDGRLMANGREGENRPFVVVRATLKTMSDAADSIRAVWDDGYHGSLAGDVEEAARARGAETARQAR